MTDFWFVLLFQLGRWGQKDPLQYPKCHPEQAKRVEGSSHKPSAQHVISAKILRLPPKICDFLQSLRMTDFWFVLLLLPGQSSELVGGVMTPPYRREMRRKSPRF